MEKVLITFLCCFIAALQGQEEDATNFKILDGLEFEPRSIPFFVSFANGTYRPCGGSILNKQWVVTTARCAKRLESLQFKVVTRYPKLGSAFEIEKIVIHPKYDQYEFSLNDIALVKIKKHFDYPIIPARVPRTNDNVEINQFAVIAGFGIEESVSQKVDSWSPTLALVNVIDLDQCRKSIDKSIYDTNLCAKDLSEKTAICAGDNGGPLVLYPGKLIGIFSNGIRKVSTTCGNKSYPAVYTRVSKYTGWIKEQIQKTGHHHHSHEHPHHQI